MGITLRLTSVCLFVCVSVYLFFSVCVKYNIIGTLGNPIQQLPELLPELLPEERMFVTLTVTTMTTTVSPSVHPSVCPLVRLSVCQCAV